LDKLPSRLQQFLDRDLVLLAGGSIVVYAVNRAFGWTDAVAFNDVRSVYLWFGLIAAYVTGFVLQEVFSLTRLQTTQDYQRGWPWLAKVGRWLGELTMTTPARFAERFPDMQSCANALDRIAAHRMICTVFAPCLLVVAGCLWRESRPRALGCLAAMLLLWVIGWTKGWQQTAYANAMVERFKDHKGSGKNARD
jgi:hypothetical protein